jgi:hypothetical protein
MVVENNGYSEENEGEALVERAPRYAVTGIINSEARVYDLKRSKFRVVDAKPLEEITQYYDLVTGRVTEAEANSVKVGGVRVVVREDMPDGGLRVILAQRRFFPEERMNPKTKEKEPVSNPFFNPLTGEMENRRVQDYLADHSVSESVYRKYLQYASQVSSSEDKVILLLGVLNESYPPTAIGEVVGLTGGTASRVVSTLSGQGFIGELVAPSLAAGPSEAYRGEVYRRGPMLEKYAVLTGRGRDRFTSLLSRMGAQEALQGSGRRAFVGVGKPDVIVAEPRGTVKGSDFILYGKSGPNMAQLSRAAREEKRVVDEAKRRDEVRKRQVSPMREEEPVTATRLNIDFERGVVKYGRGGSSEELRLTDKQLSSLKKMRASRLEIQALSAEERDYYLYEGAESEDQKYRGRVKVQPDLGMGMGDMTIKTFGEYSSARAREQFAKARAIEERRQREFDESEKVSGDVAVYETVVESIKPPELIRGEGFTILTPAEITYSRRVMRRKSEMPRSVGRTPQVYEPAFGGQLGTYSGGIPITYGEGFESKALAPLTDKTLDVQRRPPPRIVIPPKTRWTSEEARDLGDRLGLVEGYKSMRWREFVKPALSGGKLTDTFRLREIPVDLEEFRMGLEAESEHADVTGGNAVSTALIALAHLREKNDYYTRLKLVEG